MSVFHFDAFICVYWGVLYRIRSEIIGFLFWMHNGMMLSDDYYNDGVWVLEELFKWKAKGKWVDIDFDF